MSAKKQNPPDRRAEQWWKPPPRLIATLYLKAIKEARIVPVKKKSSVSMNEWQFWQQQIPVVWYRRGLINFFSMIPIGTTNKRHTSEVFTIVRLEFFTLLINVSGWTNDSSWSVMAWFGSTKWIDSLWHYKKVQFEWSFISIQCNWYYLLRPIFEWANPRGSLLPFPICWCQMDANTQTHKTWCHTQADI